MNIDSGITRGDRSIDNDRNQLVELRITDAGVSRWEIIEELDGVTDAAAAIVSRVPHGQRIDDEIGHRVHDSLGDEDYYSHRDDMNTLQATTDDLGAAVERYDYGDYGDVRFLDGSGVPLPVPSGAAYADTLVEARSLYTGRRPMPHGSSATSMVLMDDRHRVMEPYAGRFGQRDPLLYVDSMNLYAYVQCKPYVLADPFGECSVRSGTIGSTCSYSSSILAIYSQQPAPAPTCHQLGQASCLAIAAAMPQPPGTGGCDTYPADYTYLGTNARCFCECAGSSP